MEAALLACSARPHACPTDLPGYAAPRDEGRKIESLLELLLDTQLVCVSALLLTAVHCTRW